MAVKSALFYWVQCDKCQALYSDEQVWSTEADALDAAEDDWRVDDDGGVLCDECYHDADERGDDDA